MFATRYQLNVALRHTEPRIWRRLEVAAELLLPQLHQVLQCVMGWHDAHLHQFESRGVTYAVPDPDFGREVEDERKVRLSQLLRKPSEQMTYTYDFGDSWEHDVVLEQIVAGDAELNIPIVLDGERACPPEDVGGVPGFEAFLAATRDRSHPDHKDMTAWWGGPFDPEAFDRDAVNEALMEAQVQRPRRAGRRGGSSRRRR